MLKDSLLIWHPLSLVFINPIILLNLLNYWMKTFSGMIVL